jgi:ADP-ribosyl-[dinitrogen reductase] hydrolase
MRLAPVACYAYADPAQAIQLASQQSKATHASRPADESCQLVAELLCGLIDGQKFNELWRLASKKNWGSAVGSLFEHNYRELNSDNVFAGGYVIDTLHSALWSLLQSDNFEAAVIKAVNLGDDADTVGAVVGQLAGAMYGYASVLAHFKNTLIDERKLYVTSQFLSSSS